MSFFNKLLALVKKQAKEESLTNRSTTTDSTNTCSSLYMEENQTFDDTVETVAYAQGTLCEEPATEEETCLPEVESSLNDEDCSEIPAEMTVESYFADQGISCDFPECTSFIAPVESLAFNIAINYARTKEFIHFLQENISKNEFSFTFVLTPFDACCKNAIIDLGEKLADHGLITDFRSDSNRDSISGTISTSAKAINFLNGDFMKMYAKCVTIGVIKKSAKIYGCDYKLYNDVKIEKDGKEHELDIVFRLGKHVFCSQAKSEKFNPDEYKNLGEFIETFPGRFIMLAAGESNDSVASISYFYNCLCANINTFKYSLIEMINKTFHEERATNV